MNKPMRKSNQMIKIINYSVIDLPAPINLSAWWNFGVLLGMCLVIQILSGIMLSMHYTADIKMAFDTISHITRNVNYGWSMRTLHSNEASLFLICLYIHTGRGIYYGSYKYMKTWIMGVILMLLTMATAFLGYVLPWGQMSFWGATVITNLLSAIPYVGGMLVNWLWGGFAVDNATLSRFFSLHFLMPFVVLMMTVIHIFFLHQTGSNNPTGLNSNMDKIPFHPYFSIKDVMGVMITLTLLVMLNLAEPYMLSDPDNFTMANPMVTPIHIQPEWYFLFGYAILRSIPNKLGGVMALFLSIMILMILPFSMKMKFKSISFYPISQYMYMYMLIIYYCGNYTNLNWSPTSGTTVYFNGSKTYYYLLFVFYISPNSMKKWDKLIN